MFEQGRFYQGMGRFEESIQKYEEAKQMMERLEITGQGLYAFITEKIKEIQAQKEG